MAGAVGLGDDAGDIAGFIDALGYGADEVSGHEGLQIGGLVV